MSKLLRHHKVMGDERGQLIAIESGIDIPFEIKRVFYIYGTDSNISRGQHSHLVAKQYMIAVNGFCHVTLDDGQKRETYVLDRPNVGLFQDAMVWGEMHSFSPDCVLLVLSNERYSDADYIRSYDGFKAALTS